MSELKFNSERITRGIKWFEGDRVLWIVIAMLSVVSLLVVYSSTAKMAYDYYAIRTTSNFLFQQFFFLFMGLVALLMVHKVKVHYIYILAPYIFWFFLSLTMLVYFFGNSTNGAARWISILGFQFQPSEALKFSTMLYLAYALSSHQMKITKLRLIPCLNPTRWSEPKQKRIFREGVWPILFPMFLSWCVIAPAHTSSAVLLFIASMLVLIAGRVRWIEIIKIVGIVAAMVVLYVAIGAGRSETAGGRISTWMALWTTDRTEIPTQYLADTERSMVAIHNGSLFGEGAGQSAMRVEMIHPESDYAYAFFIEEYGLLLALILLLLYLWISFRAIEIFKRCNKAFSGLMVIGLAMLITCQAILHIMVTVNLMPETGQTLPLISRGGSSFLFTITALGLILAVSRENERRLAGR